MKYIKSFESIAPNDTSNDTYNNDDYVYINKDYLRGYNTLIDNNWELNKVYPLAKVVMTAGDHLYVDTISVKNRVVRFWIQDKFIDRSMTSDEIEEYESLLAGNKYNL